MTQDALELLKLIWPVVAIQFALQIFCMVKIAREGVGNLKRWAWIFIVLFFSIAGSILYLLLGRRKGEAHD